MTPQNTDVRVDRYISDLPEWQRDICNQIRLLIHEADQEIVETVKRGDRPYFTAMGNVCALLAASDHVNVFIYDPIAPDPEGIISQGQGNKTARAIQLYQGDTVNRRAFIRLVQAVISNNRAGGWRKLR
jgi:hypothetical protein